ncbi:MAG TPA: diguanylate cyclase [Nitrospiraceae bacterium]|nr:diguanylate cyclase [Nitrospiraceae bacterium]
MAFFPSIAATRPRRLSFRTKTILAVATGLVAISMLLTIMQYQRNSRLLDEEWESKAVEFARILEITIQPLLEGGDQAALSRAVAKTLLIPGIKSVTVVDAQGIIVADSSDHGVGGRLLLHLDAVREALEEARSDIAWVEARETGRVRFILIPIKAALDASPQHTQVHGAMLIGSDLSVMDRLIHANLRYLLFVNGVTFIALLAMFWIAIRIGLHPLAALAASVRSVPGAPLAAGNPGSSDEITALTETFAHMNAALHESEELSRAILNSLPNETAILDKDGHLLGINLAWERFMKEEGDLFPSVTGGFFNYLEACRRSGSGYGNHAEEAAAGIHAILKGTLPRFTLEYLCPLKKGSRWYLLSVIPLHRPLGGAIISHLDITERLGMEEQLHEVLAEIERAKNHLNALYEAIPIGVLSVNSDLIVEQASHMIADLHGRPVEDHLNQWLPNLLSAERWTRLKPIVEQVLQTCKPCHDIEDAVADNHVSGGARFLLCDYHPELKADGTARGFLITMRDVTAQRLAQQQHEQHLKELTAKNRELDQMAIRDPLTGLYNRRFFDEALTREWQQFQRSGEAFTVIIMDVDAFKAINDEYGHETGDRALQQVGTALRANLRESDLIARVGGDEFAALLPRTDTEHCEQVSEKLREVLKALHVTTSPGGIDVSLSLGSATVPGFPPVTSAAELLRVADKRMYDAKRLASSGRSHPG